MRDEAEVTWMHEATIVPATMARFGDIVALTATPADRRPAAVYLTRLAPGSRRTMHGALATIADLLTDGTADLFTLPWHALRYQHTQAVRSLLAERYAPATANKHLAALRGVLKESWRLGLMEAADFQRAIDLTSVRGGTLPRGRALTPGELRALFAVCADGSPAGVRDAALLAVLYGCGLRRAEVVSLDMSDYLPETGALTVRHGKGDKARIVYLTGGAQAATGAWCGLRGEAVGPLFPPINKGGRITVRRMTDQAILAMLQRRAKTAEVGHFSPHDLRRTFISDLLDAGADIA
ncbi:MAG: tyrosine-type recombinase/integrase, partial [Chloroflexota bacterium]|nr:tyrosine-type recombinase/integrase [Chloroflexota bacterium]